MNINEIAEKHEQIIDYIDSQFVIHILTGKEIEKEVQQINNTAVLVRYDLGKDFPVVSIKLFLKGLPEETSTLHISIGNWVFDGHAMRKQLLTVGIKKYRKSKSAYGHHYRFELSNEDQVQKIFEVFKNYLPK